MHMNSAPPPLQGGLECYLYVALHWLSILYKLCFMGICNQLFLYCLYFRYSQPVIHVLDASRSVVVVSIVKLIKISVCSTVTSCYLPRILNKAVFDKLLSIKPPKRLKNVCLLFDCPSVYQSVCRSFYLFAVCLSFCFLSLCLSFCLPFCPSFCFII